MKKIMLITMGGTISASGEDRLYFKDYQSGVFTGEDFIREIPELQTIAHLTIVSLDNVSSTRIQTSHWIRLREIITKALIVDSYDGIVITHGTSTLEETAYFIHLTVPSHKPIVFVGAQRPFTAISSDAPLNL